MKCLLSRARFLLLLLLLPLAPVFALAEEKETIFYGLDMSGTLVGYLEMTLIEPEAPGKPRVLESTVFAKMTLLEQPFDLNVEELYHLDPETGRVVYFDSRTEMGSMVLGNTVDIGEDEARVTPKAGGAPTTVALDPEVRVDDPLHFGFLLEDLAAHEGAKKTYRSFDFNTCQVSDMTATYRGEKTATLEGVEHPCHVFEFVDTGTGLAGTLWAHAETGRMFRIELSTGMTVYRAAPAVIGKIKRAELNDLLLAMVDVGIADFASISYMKVRAKLNTAGEVVTAESLNVPGQKFTGTVTNNVVEGVFEIAHPRYGGENAPVFPPDLGGDEELAKLLEPELLLEADDPILIDFAEKLTEGAENSWDAAVRLSRWVADEIVYEIPGGSARATFDSRRGECGSHSRLLVAFCRGVGIPSRVVSGCMYAPNYGGCFGQHAWTEVWMGEAGWIPVDCTAKEVDFVDSGHIRLGTQAGFMPEEMEILEHRLGTGEEAPKGTLGSFANPLWKAGETYTFTYTVDGSLAGTDSFTVESIETEDGETVITCTTALEVGAKVVTGGFQIDGNGRPLAYSLEGKVGTVEYTVDCTFDEEGVHGEAVQTGRPDREWNIPLPDEIYLLDNNNFSGYAFLLAAMPRDEPATFLIKVFHPSSMQILPVQITVGEKEAIEVGGASHDCTVCDVVIAGPPLKLWGDGQGRILRETEAGGRMGVELVLD